METTETKRSVAGTRKPEQSEKGTRPTGERPGDTTHTPADKQPGSMTPHADKPTGERPGDTTHAPADKQPGSMTPHANKPTGEQPGDTTHAPADRPTDAQPTDRPDTPEAGTGAQTDTSAQKAANRTPAACGDAADRPKRPNPGCGEAPQDTPWALITGAGTGIGRRYAEQLADRGYNLVLAGLAPEHIVRAADELRASHPSLDIRTLAIDLAREEASDELFAWVRSQGIGVDVLINNAGIFSFCDLLATPDRRIARIILLHDLTATLNCRHFAADMVRRGRGGYILNMSSFSLWMPFPGLSLYSASKAYLRSFSVAFAREVREHGIRVTAVCPAGVATDLYGLPPRWQRIGLRLGVLISAESCARRGLRALFRGRRCIVPDWWNRIWIPLCKLLPTGALRPLRRHTMKFQK
ncbi:SDR family NAD(P)-dependent oxidoreductase [uncultured Alistipes sp.]|uniref:SDR family NAD(P)-dependent oxidoreductase n=1 Tax=uncultured Alistipes sp. TaxID=538949 RepID=UPI002632C4B8|nr:SDR family NAD(P)-dependent oxidoreductase [uncultured Alistipes sp.]